MRKLPRITALAILAGFLTLAERPVLADCVSCGPGGECFSTSPGFSGNCECKIRSINGVATCRPSGVCDPNDATSCSTDSGFPQVIASQARISIRFLNGLAEVNPLLAGAVWAGVAEANSALKGDRAEVKGTMGREGKSYTYLSRVRLLADGSVVLTAHVEEEGTGLAQDYEGTFPASGRSGRFVKVGPKGRSQVYSWDSH
jgi:hypothetical protein